MSGLDRRAWLARAAAGAAALAGSPGRAQVPQDRSPVLIREFIDPHPETPQVHASTLLELPDASLLAAWFGGTAERMPDVRIWLARRVGGHWSRPRPVADGRQADGSMLPTWNPVLFQPSSPDGAPLMLFYKVGPSPQAWWGMLMTSDDGGRSWSAPRRLPDGVLGPVRSKPLQLADATLLCPSSTEAADGAWRIHFERSSDLGASWQRSEPEHAADAPNGRAPAPIDAIQPTLVARPDGSLLAYVRTKAGRIAMTASHDMGRRWSPLALTTLPNPNSAIEALGLADGRILMVFNPLAPGRDWWVGRDRLDLAVSADGGRNWRTVMTLEHEAGQEFSYPAAIQSRSGVVHLSYTWKRLRIRHVAIDPRRLG